MLSASSALPALPVVNGNSLFWAMAALIVGEFVVICRLAGAMYRFRHPQAVGPALNGPAGAPLAPQGRRPMRPASSSPELDREFSGVRPRRRRGGLVNGRMRLLMAAVILGAAAFLAGKAGLLHIHAAAAAPVPTPTLKPVPKVSAPAPEPSKHPLPRIRMPQPSVHAIAHSGLTSGELTAVLIVAALAALAICAVAFQLVRRRSE